MSHTITKHDGTVLNHAAKRGDAQELAALLNDLAQREGPNGMDRTDVILLARDDAGDNIVHSACAYGNNNILAFVFGLNEFALKPGMLLSIVNARNNIGNTPVHSATMNNQIDCLAALLERGADLNAEGSFRLRVAHFATRDRFPDMLRYVLQHGADPNAVCLSGDTPGHFAARNRDMFCLEALYTGGADLRGYNQANETPANIAEHLSNEEMMAWMFERNIF